MAYKLDDKQKAKELYIKGHSISEISNSLSINRGTLTIWMNQEEWKLLKANAINGNKNLSTKNTRLILNNIIKQAQYLLSETK